MEGNKNRSRDQFILSYFVQRGNVESSGTGEINKSVVTFTNYF